MAYTAPTSDFVTSTLSGAITAAASSATIGTGLDLPAANGILQVDYDSSLAMGVDNGPETISYTAYNSGTGAITGLTRGLNGTTGVAHANGAKVQCGPSASYWGTQSILTADIADSAITVGKIADAVITNAKLDTSAGELGGAAQTWSPTLGGWSANPASGIYYYIKRGKFITLFIAQPNNGTSNATTCTFTLPVTAVTRTSARWTAPAEVVDNGTALTTPGMAVIQSAGTTLTVAKDWGFNAFTTSGNKRVVSLQITYEIA